MRFDQASRVYISPNQAYKKKDKLAGICGNFDGDDEDDFMMPDKNTDAADPTEFGYAWRDEDDCPAPVSLDPCSENPDRQGWAEKGTFGFWLFSCESVVQSRQLMSSPGPCCSKVGEP